MKRHNDSSRPARDADRRPSGAPQHGGGSSSRRPRRKALRPGATPPNAAMRTDEQLLAAMRLPALAAVGGVLAADAALRLANRRAARRLCAQRQARIAAARDRFVSRVAGIAAADAWDEKAYAAAVREFSAARAAETGSWKTRRALAAHVRARDNRERAWSLWVEELSGELWQLLGVYTVVSDFKTPSLEILGLGVGNLRESLALRRRLRGGELGVGELRKLLSLPPAPGERRRRRGAPIRRLCEFSVSPPPTAEELLAWWGKTRGHGKVAEKIRLGSMLLDAEAGVDSSLIRDGDGEIVGRRAGLKGWLREHCPQLVPHYGALMKFRRLAAAFREEHGFGDPVPAAMLVEEGKSGRLTPRANERIAAARKEAAKLLAGPEGKTVAALAAELAERRERREEIEEARREAFRTAMRRRRRAAGGMTA